MSVVLSEHLALLVSAPEGIQKLRGLILELAVRGKLVAQEPDNNQSNWKRGLFSDFFSLEYGDNLPAPKRTGTGEYPVYGSNGIVGTHNECRVQAPCIVVGRKGSAGALNLCRENGCWVTDVAYYCIPPSDVDLDFVFVLFHTLGLDNLGKGIKPGLSRSEAYSLPVEIPPLAEQHRIVAKVDELMALCDRLEAEQADAAGAHARLVDTLLGTLTQSADAADLAANWQRLAEHFDTLFTTEASIDALKQTVLQLAVMGKLVPQNPNDEPASKLLKRIGQERARLEAGGTCKKSKSMPPVGEDEQPFEVPESWVWERIGNYAVQTDYGLSEKTLPASKGIPVLKMGDIQAGKVVLGGQKVVPLATEGLPYLFLEPDDLLYNRTNSAELVGKTGIFRGLAQQYSFASYLIRIRCFNELVSPTFLNFVMNSPMFRETEIVPHLKQQCGQANVNGTILRNMRIPVPPAAEQHRIVAKVEELMALCDLLKADLVEARASQAGLADTLIEAALEAA